MEPKELKDTFVYVVSETGNEEDNFVMVENEHTLRNIKTILTHYHTRNLEVIKSSLDSPYFKSIRPEIERIIIDVQQVIDEIEIVDSLDKLDGIKTINDETIKVRRKKLHGIKG